MSSRKQTRTRETTADAMMCRECGGLMGVGDCGLVCLNGCGKIIRPPEDVTLDELRRAWPDRVIKHAAGWLDRVF